MKRWILATALALTTGVDRVQAAQCDAKAENAAMLTCRTDFAKSDATAAVADCATSANVFRTCERTLESAATPDHEHLDFTSFYVAVSLYGRANAEKRLGMTAASASDYTEVRRRLAAVERHRLLPTKILTAGNRLLETPPRG